MVFCCGKGCVSSSEQWSIGPPTAAVVPKGYCAFSDDFTPATLAGKIQVTPDTYLFTFSLPDKSKPLNLSTCACILAKCRDDLVRPYTPVSTNSMMGKFQLLVKVYEKGKMSQHLKQLKMGSSVEFKHIPPNVKIQYPFDKRHIAMLVGGTGITPMIQAMHAILGTKGDLTEISLLYGSRTQKDILGKSILDDWETLSDRLSVTHVLSHEEEGSDWKGPRGFITKKMVQKYFPPPSDDTLVFVCGPPIMYDIFCGPRTEKKVTGVLNDLGFSESNVFKF